jgi:hypothetical protein
MILVKKIYLRYGRDRLGIKGQTKGRNMKTLLLIIALFTASINASYVKGVGRVKTGHDDAVRPLLKEFNNYDVKRLEHLTDSLLVGEIDTTLDMVEMVEHFINTSLVADKVTFRVDSTSLFIVAYFRPRDNSIVLSSRVKDKNLAMCAIIHELTHYVQFENDYYTYGRKTIIVNELFADHIAIKRLLKLFGANFCETVRQDKNILMRYVDSKYLNRRVWSAWLISIHYMVESLRMD